MIPRQSFIIVSIKFDVKLMMRGQLFNESFDVVHTANISHCSSWKIGVATWSIIVFEELWLIWNIYSKIFSYSCQNISSNPSLVSYFYSKAGSYLELPLTRHNLRVGTRYFDTRIQTCLVMSLHYCSSKTNICTYRAVIRTLGPRESWLWPT